MAIIVKQGIWSNATYPWTDQTGNGLMGSIVAEIDTWVSLISSNASIIANGSAPVKVREPSDSTDSGVTNGFGYQFPDTTASGFGPSDVHLIAYGTETSFNMEVGDEFVNTTANSGFGDMDTNLGGHRTFDSFSGDASFDREAMVVYDDTDEEEFIAVGFKLGTGSTDSGGFCIFRDRDLHWCFLLCLDGFGYDNILGYWVGEFGDYGHNPGMLNNTSYSYPPLIVRATSFFNTSNVPGYDQKAQGYWQPANSALYSSRNTTSALGNYLILSSTNEAMVECGSQNVTVRIPYTGGP